MGTGDAVALAFGGLDHEEETAVVGRSLVEFEGEGFVGAHDGGAGGRLHTHKGRRSDHDLAAAGDNPEVETGEQVRPGDLGLGSEDGTAFLREGEFIPGEDLLAGQTLPLGGEHLEDALDFGLVAGTDTGAIATILDVLPALHFGSGHALGATGHLFERDRRNVLHSLKRLSLLNKRYSIAIAINRIAKPPIFIMRHCQKVSSFSM